MASTEKRSDTHWIVRLKAKRYCSVTVEVMMGKEQAEALAKEGSDLGEAVLSRLQLPSPPGVASSHHRKFSTD